MRSRAVAMLCVLVLVVTGCGGKKGGGGPQTTELEVTASDTACTVAKTTLPAGRHTFAVTNKGTKVTEFYVYGAGDRVVGEVENVSPGLRRTLVVDLTAGQYESACKPGMVGDGIRTTLTVTGTAPSGFHRLENERCAGVRPDPAVADQLTKDVAALKEQVGKVELTPLELANGAKELLDEVAGSKLTGEEDRYSHTDLWDFQANVEGSKAAVAALRPYVDERDSTLGRTLDERFAMVQAELSKYGSGDGFVGYQTLSKDQVKALSDALNGLGEPVSKVAAVVAK